MDNLVLIRVAASYDRTLAGAVVRDFREEAPRRFRLLLLCGDRIRSVVISLDPRCPWTGRPVGRRRRPKREPGRFAAVVARALRGAVVAEVRKPPAERSVAFRFHDGQALIAELVPNRANLVLVGPGERVVLAAGRPGRPRQRLRTGEPYRPPGRPAGRLDPFASEPGRIRDRLRSPTDESRVPEEGLDRSLLGVGRVAAGLLVKEARVNGCDLLDWLDRRLGEVLRGEVDPVIEADEDPRNLVAQGRVDAIRWRLLPWMPRLPGGDGLHRTSLSDAAETAGLYHGASEAAAEARGRAAALMQVLETHVRRTRAAEANAARDAEAFAEPDRFRLWGEALLAGLAVASRAGERALVPDPYDPDGSRISVPIAPDRSLAASAEAHFARHRRALRGLERARQRQRDLGGRRARLEALRERHAGRTDVASADSLERAMQDEGIPVGLTEATGRRAGPAVARVEGVRVFLSPEREIVLVGRSARDNHRLTFKLAGPEDFWFHAMGAPGAHVVVRNPRRVARPSTATLTAAAEAAAWFSDARAQLHADVQWTRRKYVRKLRGAPPGTVRLKRFETLRVRPRCPPALEETP